MEKIITTNTPPKLNALKRWGFTIGLILFLFIIHADDIHAASGTINRNGYLYIPKSAGCPQFPVLWARKTTEYDGTDDDGSFRYYTHYDGVTTSAPGVTPPSYSWYTTYENTGRKAILWYSGYSAHYGSYGTDNDSKDSYSVYLVIDPNAVIDGNNLRFRILGQVKSGRYENYYTSPGYQITSVSWVSTRDTSYSLAWSNYESVPYSVSIPTNGSHSFSTTANATCTTAATQKCSKCGLTQSVGSPLGHSWGDWIILKEATVYEEGSKKHICNRNSSHTETVVIPQKRFNIFAGNNRINKLYIGNTLIYNQTKGSVSLVQ